MANVCGFNVTNSKQIVHELAGPLFAIGIDTDEVFACGTATIIGRGYAITAKHVIEDFTRQFGTTRDAHGTAQTKFRLFLYLTLNEGADLLPLGVLRGWHSGVTDIAILFLGVSEEESTSDRAWKVPSIQLLPPSVGDRISAFGFTDPVFARPTIGMPTFDVKPRTATGEVVEVHAHRRDSARLSFPCFRVNARFDGSMSGAPVFNAAGNLCGIVCSSLPADDAYAEHISYVTTLWPMMGIPIDHVTNDGQPRPSNTLSEYFDGGHFFAVDRDKVFVNFVPGHAHTVSIRT